MLRAQAQSQITRSVTQAPKVLTWRAQENPLWCQRRLIKVITRGNGRPIVFWQIRRRISEFHSTSAWTHDRPAVLPTNRGEKCFAAQVVEIATIGPHRQHHHPPVAALRLNQIGVTRS